MHQSKFAINIKTEPNQPDIVIVQGDNERENGMASANWHNAITEQMENNTSDKQTILRGLATVNSYADDILAAKKWYTELLGIEPYSAPILNTQPT